MKKIKIAREWLVSIPDEWKGLPVEEIRDLVLRNRRIAEYPDDDPYEDYQKPGTVPFDEGRHAYPTPLGEADETTRRHRKNILIEALFAKATTRQKKILRCIQQGMDRLEIAEHLDISESTVNNQIARLKAKIRPKM